MRSLTFVLVCFCVKELLAEKSCSSFESCGACINFGGAKCVWCLEHNITASRCQSASFFSENGKWCKKNFVYNPEMETLQYIKNDPLRAQGKLKAVQFRPQEITLKVRPGQPVEFSMFYQPAKDFPLDVYYLMDTSYTMNKLVENLKNQVRFIYKKLSNFTNNVQFGLGSFVEKPDFPYVGEPQRAYSFRHHLSLTQNVSLFETILSETRNYSNYDLPEAGLDALMQVMACDKVGWRQEVRRIIVLCTDATYHSAGDGKMVLAYKPNDMKCHLNSAMFYDYSLIQDYPSVSQINKMATDGNFKIIFAVSNVVKETYRKLANEILGASRSILNMKSQLEIFDIIKTAYLESLGSVTMKYQWPPHVQLKLTPDCTQGAYCKVVHKQAVEMKATLKVNYCPEDTSQHRQVLEVGPINAGLGDKLKINLQIVCQCECEKDNSGIKNSTRCRSFGTYQCGICKCNKDRYGDICQCDGTDTSKTDLDKCKKDKNDTSFCSGRGNCVCGKCTCNTGFSGDFCEYDDSACKRHNDKLCSDNGRCTHGACECDSADWSGDDCSCSMHNDNCLAPHSEEICTGNGDCVCNECVCRVLRGKEERYSGAFCEDCEECAERRCKELEGYVKCNFMFNKTHCDEQYNQTSNTEVQMLNKTEMNAFKWPIAKWCQAKLDEDKSIVFIHLYDKNDKKLLLKIQNEEEVTPKANIWVPVGIAIASVILIGLLTVLVWKLLVDAMDEREYSKFMKESQSDGYDVSENPFYQPASVNFANPAYIAENKLVNKHDQ